MKRLLLIITVFGISYSCSKTFETINEKIDILKKGGIYDAYVSFFEDNSDRIGIQIKVRFKERERVLITHKSLFKDFFEDIEKSDCNEKYKCFFGLRGIETITDMEMRSVLNSKDGAWEKGEKYVRKVISGFLSLNGSLIDSESGKSFYAELAEDDVLFDKNCFGRFTNTQLEKIMRILKF